MLNSNTSRLSTHIATAAFAGLLAIGASLGAQAVAQSRPPQLAEYSNNNFDRGDELKVTGQIEMVEGTGNQTVVWVVAKNVVVHGARAQPGAEARGKGMLWRVEGPGLKDLKVKDLPKLVTGSKIVIVGYNSDDKSCEPTCRISSRSIKLS